MKLDKETVLELMNEAASYHGPMISVSKERIIDLCDTALYAVAPVPEVAFSESDLLRAMDIVRTWGDSTTNAGCLEILKRNPPQNGTVK